MRQWHVNIAFSVTCCIGLQGIAAANAFASEPAPKLEIGATAKELKKIRTILDVQNETSLALKAEGEKLLSRLDAQEQRLIDSQRKSIDWWLTAIGVGLTAFGLIAAIGGVWIPMYFQRVERKRLKDAEAEFNGMKKQAVDTVDNLRAYWNESRPELEQIKKEAEQALGRLRSHEEQGAQKVAEIEKARKQVAQFKSGQELKDADKVGAAVHKLEEAPDPIDQLRARAIKASQIENPTFEQAENAYELWKALTVLEANDQSAQFNAGYWAQQIYKLVKEPSRRHWRAILEQHYLMLPNSYEATNNLGLALAEEARTVALADLDGARALWLQAGAKFAQALRINDKWAAAYNWGLTLAEEARVVAPTDLSAARSLWQQAKERYAQAWQSPSADKHEVACDWGVALGEEASVVAQTNVRVAFALWHEAREQFSRALHIKADMHDAIDNWAVAYIHECHALRKVQQLIESDSLLRKAQILLEQHITKYPETIPKFSYNLACIYAMQSQAQETVIQLEIARRSNRLSAHWREDPDFASIRESSEYLTWLNQHFS